MSALNEKSRVEPRRGDGRPRFEWSASARDKGVMDFKRVAPAIRSICAAAALTVAAAVPAQAAENSFHGSCNGSGTATFDKPVTATAADNVIHARGGPDVRCTGTLNGVHV